MILLEGTIIMNKYRVICSIALFFVLCATPFIGATRKTPSITHIIKKARSHPADLKSADLDVFCDYINSHWFDQSTDPKAKEINSLLNDPQIVKQVVHIFVHHSINDSTINSIIQRYPTIATALIPAVAQSIDTIKTTIVSTLLSWQPHPDIVKTLATAAIKSIATTCPQTIAQIIMYQTSFIEPFLKAAFENPATPITTINTILHTAQNYGIVVPAKYNMEALKIRVKNFFAKKQPKITASTLVMIVFYKYMYGSLPQTLPALTQTQQHVIANYNLFFNSETFSTYTSQQLFASMIDQITLKERELDLGGYVSFVHAQRWHYRIIEQWYTKLWETYSQKSAGEFLFIHCTKPCRDEAQLKKEKKLRNHILKHGREPNTREKLLFLNYAFFGNENNNGSSSSHYFIHNSNVHPIHLYLKDVFDLLDYGSYYQKYKDELEELEDEHDSLCSYGQVLLIGVPKVILPECVFFAKQCGYKDTTYIPGHGYIDDINIIIDTLRTNPGSITDSNRIEFCLILTDDMLTPDTGIKVYTYNAADPTIIAEFDKKSNELFERIKKEIEQDRQAKAVNTVEIAPALPARPN